MYMHDYAKTESLHMQSHIRTWYDVMRSEVPRALENKNVYITMHMPTSLSSP